MEDECRIEMRLQGLDLCEEDLAQPFTPPTVRVITIIPKKSRAISGFKFLVTIGICAVSIQPVSIF